MNYVSCIVQCVFSRTSEGLTYGHYTERANCSDGFLPVLAAVIKSGARNNGFAVVDMSVFNYKSI